MAADFSAPGSVPDIPWATPSAWEEANVSLNHALQIHGPALSGARIHSRQIRSLLESARELTGDLCSATCPHCPEPCCAHAKVWLDFRDLLFLHLERLPIPPTQLRSGQEGSCLYLGHRGCLLDRLSRPFVCFWYFCPPQTLRLSRMPREKKILLDQAISTIKTHRKAMEDAFIQAVAGKYP
ncbi:MAG: hypothetical protein JEZ02_14675 [Desulfatibacillum sp.]|nr:hypothetical protein [Desulfatibacillum sp.]